MTIEEIVKIMNDLSQSYEIEYNNLLLSNSLTDAKNCLLIGKQLTILDLSNKIKEHFATKSVSTEE